MALHRKDILGAATIPDTSGTVYFDVLSNHTTTNDRWPAQVVVFEDSGTRIGLHGRFNVPKDFVTSGPKLIIGYTGSATVGNCQWDFEYRAVDNAESMDQSGQDESVNVAGTHLGTAFYKKEVEINLTGTNFAVDDEVQFTLYRDGADAGDTMAADVLLTTLMLQYQDA